MKFWQQVDYGSDKTWANFRSDLFAGNDTVPISMWQKYALYRVPAIGPG